MRDALAIIVGVVLLAVAGVILGVILRFIGDARFRPRSVDWAVFGGSWTIQLVGNVRDAAVIDLLSFADLCQHLSIFPVNMFTRLQRRVLVVYTGGLFVYFLTPKNPYEALDQLALGPKKPCKGRK